MSARLRTAAEQALSAGWHAEAFARTKRLEPLGQLLDRRSDEQKADLGNASALALFQRFYEEQERAHGAE